MTQPAKILIVDDERANRKMLADRVRHLGHEAILAASGAEALALLGHDDIDVVLLDLMMPGLSGLDVLDRLRGLGLTPGLPVVVVSALADHTTRTTALALGATDFLSKPVDGDELAARLRTLITLRRLTTVVAGSLRDAEKMHRALMAGAPVPMLVLDLAGRILEANATATAMYAPALLPLEGRRFVELIRPPDGAVIEAALDRLGRGGPGVTAFIRVSGPHGDDVELDISASLVEAARGRRFVVVGRDVTAERRDRRELAGREAELRRAQAVAQVGSVHLDLVSQAPRYSAESLRILGLPAGAGAGAYLSRVHPDDRQRVAQEFERARQGLAVALQHRIVVAGAVRWVTIQAEVEADVHGQPSSMLATVQDITDVKLADVAREDSLRFKRAILDSLTARVAIVDDQGVIVATNRAWREAAAQAAGGPGATVEGMSYLAACGAVPEGEAIARGIRDAIAGAVAGAPVEYRCESRSGPRWYACRIRRFGGAGPPWVVVAHDDVTRMKLAQFEAAEHAQRLEVLVTNLPLVVWEATFRDRAYVVRWVSANVEQVLGVAAAQLIGTVSWASFIHADDLPILRRHAAAGAPEQWMEHCRWVRPGGAVVHLQAGATTRRNPDGSIALLGFGLDISDAKQLEAGLLRARKLDAVGQLTGGISHDFNNLLAVILSFAGFAHADLPPGDERRSDLDKVIGAANKGVELSRQLKTFSRPQPVVKRPTDVNRSVAALVQVLQRSGGAHLELVVTPSHRAAIVHMDPAQLDQVLMNLAVNARDAMAAGGQLRLTVSHPAEVAGPFAPGRYLRIVVADTGDGMSPATLARLYEPFFTTKDIGRGTGLGLATCYAIVREAGGTIGVASELGRGTRFTIDLPVCDLPLLDATATPGTEVAAARSVTAVTAPPPAPTAAPMTLVGPTIESPRRPIRAGAVLVVEDDAEACAIFAQVLRSARLVVTTAASGEEALVLLQRQRFDAVVTDLGLPGIDGLAVLRAAQAHDPDLPVVLITGRPSAESATSAVNSRAISYLVKPVRLPQLVAEVEEAVKVGELARLQRRLLATPADRRSW